MATHLVALLHASRAIAVRCTYWTATVTAKTVKGMRDHMKRVVSAPEYGLMFIEDSVSGDISIQCLCGQMASWWKRVVLNADEIDELRAGTLDSKRMMVEICRDSPSVVSRLVRAIELKDLVPAPTPDHVGYRQPSKK